MSLAQQLVLRALIATFWERPYAAPLASHGDAPRDAFMLPFGVWSGFLHVRGDLGAAGFAIDPGWFEPRFDFRFALAGAVSQSGIAVEARTAIEPWRVLGEEGTIGGAARHVDSSPERIQVRVKGDLGDRCAVACNGWTLPLAPATGPHDLVAGVRFRAWRPPARPHATIGAHAPLTIENYDLAQGRSLGAPPTL